MNYLFAASVTDLVFVYDVLFIQLRSFKVHLLGGLLDGTHVHVVWTLRLKV